MYEEHSCAFFLGHTQDTSLPSPRGARVGGFPGFLLTFKFDFKGQGLRGSCFLKGQEERHPVFSSSYAQQSPTRPGEAIPLYR